MKYIYTIKNKKTGESYVGKTIDYNRRQGEHLLKLRENRHPNPKLQASFNKHGEEFFFFSFNEYEGISDEELNEMEILEIRRAKENGGVFNLTEGGTGGDTRSKLNFEEYCFAYFGNKKYDGMTNRTAKYLNVDSSTVSAIRSEKAYLFFKKEADKLPQQEKNDYLESFEKELDIKNNKPWTVRATPEDELTYEMMCVASTYGRGIEGAMLRKHDLSKGYLFHLMTGPGRQEVKKRYFYTPVEERQRIGREKFLEWNLKDYTTLNIKEEEKDLFLHYLKELPLY